VVHGAPPSQSKHSNGGPARQRQRMR
jgi:hypothetical protein